MPSASRSPEGAPPGDRRPALREEVRSLLALPAWSNLRGDDVIALVESLDAETRARVTALIAQLRELEDAALDLRLRRPS